jgi:CxxC-x17-CxxC domain-containing protein
MIQRRRHGRIRGPKPSRPKRPKSYKIVCAGCGKEFVVPVPPPDDKKLLCTECFSKREISKEEI